MNLKLQLYKMKMKEKCEGRSKKQSRFSFNVLKRTEGLGRKIFHVGLTVTVETFCFCTCVMQLIFSRQSSFDF